MIGNGFRPFDMCIQGMAKHPNVLRRVSIDENTFQGEGDIDVPLIATLARLAAEIDGCKIEVKHDKFLLKWECSIYE